MFSVKDEIRSAVEKLNLSSMQFRALPDEESETVYFRALRTFVREGDPRWWWEHFPYCTSIKFSAGDGWQHIAEFVPDVNEHVWFIAEDDQLPFCPVYDAVPSAICAVIAECYGFEYYLVQKKFEWLICENHHDYIIGVGNYVEEQMRNHAALE